MKAAVYSYNYKKLRGTIGTDNDKIVICPYLGNDGHEYNLKHLKLLVEDMYDPDMSAEEFIISLPQRLKSRVVIVDDNEEPSPGIDDDGCM
jgi:hypothetical protein